MSIRKKIIASIVATTVAASILPLTVGAVTVEELLAQIAQLQAQLAQLQAQQGGGVPSACVGITFTRYLTVGSTGADVKCLQALLNLSPTTRVAETGPGSPGNETTYFGPKTLAAVQKYQAQQGWTPANQVGPKTIAALNARLSQLASTTTPSEGTSQPAQGTPAEGSFTATIAASPASNANITSTSNVPIYGIQIKAVGSNIKIERVDLQLGVSYTSGTLHPATLIKNLYAYDGSTLLVQKAITSSDVLKDSLNNYYVRLGGINFNVPKDQTKVLTITADFYENLEADRNLTVQVYGNQGIRGVDTLGINSWGGLSTSRTHVVKYGTIGTSTLTITRNINTPKSTTVRVDDTDGATDVPMLAFDLKSTTGTSKVTQVVLTVSGETGAADKINAVKLYDGYNLLGSASVSSNTATFSDLEIYVPKDTTKTLTAKVDFAAGVTSERKVLLRLLSNAVTYEKPNLSTATGPTSNIDGYYMYVFDEKAAIFTISSLGTASYSYNSQTPSASAVTGVITFKVRAEGGTMTKPTTAHFDVRVCTSAGNCTNTADSVAVTVSPDSDIPDGNEATVTVTATETRGASALGLVYFKINSIDWTVGTTSVNDQTWGLDDFKTVYVNAH